MYFLLQKKKIYNPQVPDYKFMINTSNGPESSLAEFKTISAGQSRYPRGVRGKGTDRRDNFIPIMSMKTNYGNM